MSAQTAGQLVVVLLLASWVSALVACTRAGLRIWTPLALFALLGAGGVAGAADSVDLSRPVTALMVATTGLLALTGGGPLTTLVFDLVDRREPQPPPGAAVRPDEHDRPVAQTLVQAGSVLRGGLWIGGLERLAVFATLVSGWPEGIAIVLAIKGLGRYPELRTSGAAERFIIGTFTSVLWAVGCAGVVLLSGVLD